MQLEVWILTEDLSVAKKVSSIFRSYDIVPQYFRSVQHFQDSLKNSKYNLLVLDSKFDVPSELEKTILLTRDNLKADTPSIGVVHLEYSLEGQFSAIIQRFLKIRELQKDNYKFHLLNQAFSSRNENLNMAKEETSKRNQSYDNLWNIISLFGLHEQQSFLETCSHVFDGHKDIETYAYLVKDGTRWMSQGTGKKIIFLDTILNFNIRDAAKRLAEERIGKSVILHITDEELNLDKMIFIKANMDINWFGLENYLSLLNNHFRFRELKSRIGQELLPSNFLDKLREVSGFSDNNKFYLEVSFKKISNYVVNSNAKVLWPQLLREFTNTLIKHSPTITVTQWGIERVFVVGYAIEPSPVIKLIENFPVWRFFSGHDKPVSQNLAPTVKYSPLREREGYALQN